MEGYGLGSGEPQGNLLHLVRDPQGIYFPRLLF
jgi:hypothetical protein